MLPKLELFPIEGFPMASGPNQVYRGANGAATKAKDERGLYRIGLVASFCTLAVAILMATGGFFVWALRQESRMTKAEEGLAAEKEANKKRDSEAARESDKAEAWRIRMERKWDEFIAAQQQRR